MVRAGVVAAIQPIAGTSLQTDLYKPINEQTTDDANKIYSFYDI